MRDIICVLCGKSTGRGGRNRSKKKHMGGYAHYECYKKRVEIPRPQVKNEQLSIALIQYHQNRIRAGLRQN